MTRSIIHMPVALAAMLALGTLNVGCADADETLKQGDPIGAFYVTKIAGAEDDGVEAGEQLCYRCRYGSSPMVMVFARDTGGKVGNLVKELDTAVAENEEMKLKGLVTLLGSDAKALKVNAGKFVENSGVKNVPVVIAEDVETGPTNYKLDDSVEVTVVVANDSQVVATHTFDADEVNVAAVMKEVKQMLN